jgi:YnfA/UPF0060 family uncharacterized protein
LDKPAWWALPGIGSLRIFAWLLTRIDSEFAEPAYAAYGGIYIAGSLLWLWAGRSVFVMSKGFKTDLPAQSQFVLTTPKQAMTSRITP